MNNYKLVKNTEWKDVEINGEDKEIPSDWTVDKLDKKITVINGYAFPKSLMLNEKTKNSIPIIKIGNIQDNKIINHSGTGQNYFVGNVKPSFIPQLNDLIVGLSGANAGKSGVFKLKEICALNQRNAIIRSMSKNLNQDFFNYSWIFSLTNILLEGIKDSAIPNISSEDISNIECLLPPIQTQSSIASILSEQESIINEMEELIGLYEKRLRYTSNELLSGRLRIKEVDGETILYKNEKWKTVKVNGKDIEIPEDWCKHLISDVFNIKRGKVISKEDIKKKKGIYPVYSSATENNGVIGNISDFMFNGEYLTWTTDGVYAGTLFYRKGKFNCTNVCGVLEKINLQLDTKSIYYFLKPNLPKYVTKLANSKLMSNTVAKIEFIFPEKNEENILISKTLTQQEELIQEQKELLELEKKRFTWLLENLLSGKYTVEESDDESLGKISLTDNSENVN